MPGAGTSPSRTALAAVRAVAPRILQFVFVVWATYTVTFLLIRILPGDPVLAALAVQSGDATTVDPEQLAALREEAGLAGSVLSQYLAQLGGLLTGDLGTSLATGRPVTQMISDVVPGSLAVAGLALVVGVTMSLLVGFLAYVSPWRWLRDLLVQLPPLGVAVPAFVTGLVLISVFSFTLGWFPASGARSPLSVVLPAVTLAFPVGAIFFQVFSAAIREAEGSAYVFTADVKGLSRLAIFGRHILRNAMLPSVTSIGLLVGFLAGGTAVVETVFSRDGIGRIVVAAVQARDVNVIQGVIIVVAVVYALAALLVDLSYPLLDPRLRTRGRVRPAPVVAGGLGAVAAPGEAPSGSAPSAGEEAPR
ncbi:ABC transporter permease [Microbacterium betulae]|uniref:ABC transporter permease n=1 Tax=Microbacterium betulae TaxID=2981139 RepID=A0AA97FH23_9MICO|nr:ABC transporter permease [Microbacterium sp. AB]WOF23018.1 ABC transporter permease [Microbacterium sp. AB]